MANETKLRPMPGLARFTTALITAVTIPAIFLFVALAWLVPTKTGLTPADVLHGARLLGVLAAQALVFAVPIGLYAWRRMQFPLFGCILLGALSAPGPLGYMGITLLVGLKPLVGFAVFLVVAAVGALGGFLFWAIATQFGKRDRASA